MPDAAMPPDSVGRRGPLNTENRDSMRANIPPEWNKFYLKDVSFVNLMTRRIFNVLIVANPYDAFMLEDDGRVDEKLGKVLERAEKYAPAGVVRKINPMKKNSPLVFDTVELEKWRAKH